MAFLEDVRRIAMSLPRTSERLIDAWCMVVPNKVADAYLEGLGIDAGD